MTFGHLRPARPLLTVVAMLVSLLAGPVVAASPAGAATVRLRPGDSIEAALLAARPGDTIVLGNGTYGAETLDLVHLTGRVNVRGESRTGVVVRGLDLREVRYVTFSDMTLTNLPGSETAPIRVGRDSRYVDLMRLTVRPVTMSGVDITDGARDVRLVDSVVDASRTTDSERSRGVRLYAGRWEDTSSWVRGITIERNEIFGAAADLVQIHGAANVRIRRNVLREVQDNSGHNDGVQVLSGRGIRIDSNRFWSRGTFGPNQAIIAQPSNPAHWISDLTIVNNLISAWPGTGIIVGGTTRTNIVNNTIQPQDPTDTSWVASSLHVASPNTDLRIWNNIIMRLDYAAGTSAAWEDNNCIRFGGQGSGTIRAYPQFADTASLALSPSSPCRAAASRTGAPLVDIDGRARGNPPDIGAIER